MALLDKKESARIRIDITGKDGNVFHLIKTANRLCRRMEMSEEERISTMNQMMYSDYENAVAVFEINFGFAVDLIIDPRLSEVVQKRIDGINATGNVMYDLHTLGL